MGGCALLFDINNETFSFVGLFQCGHTFLFIIYIKYVLQLCEGKSESGGIVFAMYCAYGKLICVYLCVL